MLNGHGDDLHKYKNIRMNFSSNVYNHFDHEGLFCHLADKLDNVLSYPEPTPQSLEMELAMQLSLKPENICVTNGATEAIYLIAQTHRRSKSAIRSPTFAEYADACRLHEHQLCNIYTLDEVPERAELVWLCNPNNPTGTVLDKEQLTTCIEKHPDTTFVIDASYAPFTLNPLITPLEGCEYKNVIMIHSMTKEFAIPGLRLGYITACEDLLHSIRLQRMPWSVNQVAIDAGHYLLVHQDEFELDIQALLSERQRIADALSRIGVIDVWPSDTHILLCKLRFGRADALKDYLAHEHGILIRDASNFAGLDSSFFRIAVQTPEENDALVGAIIKWIAE